MTRLSRKLLLVISSDITEFETSIIYAVPFRDAAAERDEVDLNLLHTALIGIRLKNAYAAIGSSTVISRINKSKNRKCIIIVTKEGALATLICSLYES